MADEVNYAFHAGELLKNPAWKKLLENVRRDLAREAHGLALDDRDGRWAVSVAQSMVTKLERTAGHMTERGKVEQFHANQRKAVA